MAVQLPPPDTGLELRRLGPGDARELHRFLVREPSANAYFLGQVARGALADETVAGALVACRRAATRELVGAACLGSNLVLSHVFPEGCLADLARASKESGWLIRVVVGPDALVDRFMDAFDRATVDIALERGGQLLFEVDAHTIAKDARSPELRPAQLHEVDALLAADLAMVVEELGVDPFSSDWSGFRRGWLRRIQEWRAWIVGPLGGPVRFKVDQAAVSTDVIQLAGVWTRPGDRGRGLARRALGEMCHTLLREVPRLTLFVHADNLSAVRLYRSLGFYEVGRVRSVWLDTGEPPAE